MSGLLQRAVEYLKSTGKLRLVRPDEDEFDGTPEERAEIERAIQRAVEENRIPVGPETFQIRPRKRGAVLPLLVNLIAIIVIAAGVFFLVRLLGNQEQTVVSRSTAIASTEGRLLTQLREQSEAELAQKQAEIAEIERRLAEVESEREQIRADAENRLVSRETELRTEFEAALEAERARLAELGLSDEEQQSRLAEFEREQLALLDAQLAEVRAAAEEELRAQEAALQALQTEVQGALAAAEAEQQNLQARFQAEQAELRAQFQAREEQLSGEAEAAATLLEELQAQQENRQLILDQILGFYGQIRTAIDAGDLDAADTALASLRSYLQSGQIATIPELQRRRQVELFLVSTIEQQLNRTRAAASVDTRSLVASAGLIAEVGELINSAEGAFESGNIEQARELYVAALSEIPAVELGYTRLAEIEASLADDASSRVADLIASGNDAYVTGNYSLATDLYAQALATLPSPDDQLLGRIVDAGYQLRASDDLAELADLRNELSATQDELAATQNELATTGVRLTTVNELLATERARTAELEQELQETDAALAAATTPTETSQATDEVVANLEQALANADARIAILTEALAAAEETAEASAQGDIAALQASLAEVRAELSASQTELASTTSALSDTQTELETSRSELSDTRGDLQTATTRGESLEEELASVQSELDRLRAASTAGDQELARAQEALDQATLAVADLESQVSTLQDRLEEQRAIADRITAYRASFAALPGSAASNAIDSLELLETKLLILRIVNSEAIRADYPDLSTQLNDYLDALVLEQQRTTVPETVEEVTLLLTDLARETSGSIANTEDLVARYPLLTQLSTARRTDLLDRLRAVAGE